MSIRERKYTPQYEKGIKENQKKSMETTVVLIKRFNLLNFSFKSQDCVLGNKMITVF